MVVAADRIQWVVLVLAVSGSGCLANVPGTAGHCEE